MSFGHAGTIVEGKEDSATEKIARSRPPGSRSSSGSTRSPGRSRRSWGVTADGRAMERRLHRRRGLRRGPDDAELAAKLEEVCPVDIFAADDGGVEIVRENLDECVLCELCVEAAPPGGVVVKKLYDGTELSSPRPPGRGARSGTRSPRLLVVCGHGGPRCASPCCSAPRQPRCAPCQRLVLAALPGGMVLDGLAVLLGFPPPGVRSPPRSASWRWASPGGEPLMLARRAPGAGRAVHGDHRKTPPRRPR